MTEGLDLTRPPSESLPFPFRKRLLPRIQADFTPQYPKNYDFPPQICLPLYLRFGAYTATCEAL